MTWPHATDYNAAVQNPQLCFRDEDLRQGQTVGDLFGLPRPHSGNFADVYQIQGADGQSWAVKCFTRPVSGLHPRYHAISEHLRQAQRAFMVEFHFLDEGICIRGQWYPLVKMRWVEGFRLNEFIGEQVNKPVVLDRLAQLWVRLGQELRDADMAHGDLQHGNVLLVPGSKSSSLALKLIDYDGMYVPALADRPSGEVGHPNYQHPQRLREGGYDRHMDRFAHLLIYTALRCLRLDGEELWQRYDNQENLLFREEDFRQPAKSRLLRELWDVKDRDTQFLVGHLLLTSQGPLGAVPALDDLVDESGIRPLSDREEARIDDLLHDDAWSGERGRVSAPSAVGSRGANATPLAAPTVKTAALLDTQPIAVGTKTDETPLPSVPRTPRRSFAEIEMDAQPPQSAASPKKSFDLATLTEPVVSILSRPGWLAALGAIALLSFLTVNVLVWSSVKQPARTDETKEPASNSTDEQILQQPSPGETSAVPRSPLPSLPPRSQTPFGNARRETPFRAHEDGQAAAKQSFAKRVPKQSLGTSETRDREPTEEDSAKVQDKAPNVRLNGKTPDSLSVEVGSKGELRVFLDRNGYGGEVEVRLEDLPDGATAQPVFVPASNDFAPVLVETTIETKRGKHVLKLLLRQNEETVAERALTLNVQTPHGRTEQVSFETVDHAELAGTLHHGWKGKKGMTVLMLHGLRQNRNTPGWRHLAETLQAEGHTVLTFDFRGHGDSTKVSAKFWAHSVNKYLPVNPSVKRSNHLNVKHLPTRYVAWLIEDIAAARTFLDLRHDEPNGPVNTFNLVVIGAGQASALGSLWLATEGLRFNAADVGDKIVLKPPEKLSIRQVVWIGVEDPLKLSFFGVYSWLRDAHAKPVVPITFIYGADDHDTSDLLREAIRKKLGEAMILPKTRLSGQQLLDDDADAAARIERYLVKTLQTLPPVDWVPRKIKSLHSYWALPVKERGMRLFVTAKRPGEERLSAVPMFNLGIPVDGVEEVSGVLEKLENP
jgi:pimeloyl-ACP methyl ester carboxylesterase